MIVSKQYLSIVSLKQKYVEMKNNFATFEVPFILFQCL